MKISACYIVKDEEKNLPKSIESLKDAVDEIIVVDTGSVDNTPAIAKFDFNAMLFHEAWQNDFSAPRNKALSHATGDWIIFLDADEYFTEETAKNLRLVIEKMDKTSKNGILIHLVNIDEDEDNKILDATFTLRIFRNLRGLEYVGKIHEELRLKGKELKNLVALPAKFLTLEHTGYSASKNRAKAERNLKMLLKEMEHSKTPQKFYGYLAQCYNGIDDFVNAEKYAKMDIKTDVVYENYSSSSFRILLSILSRDEKRLNERIKIAQQASNEFNDMPDFYAELAECYAEQKNFGAAIESMKTALEKFQTYNGTETSIFDERLAEVAKQRIISWQK